ncbi:MAG: transposase [Flavobacteriales bacterium Tduv]
MKTRWVVERTFGSIKRCFRSGKPRYKRLARVHARLLWRLWLIILYCISGIIMNFL